MRISLLYNANAGDGFSLEELRREIQGAGHELVREIEKGADLDRAAEGIDLIVVAGGDGTVRRAVQSLHRAELPFAVLPFGTANNIAHALGIEGSLRELTRRWFAARRLPFDLGSIQGDWGEKHFLEGVGIELIPELIAAAQARQKVETAQGADAELEKAQRVFHETLTRLTPRRCMLTADGKRLDGEFLLVEILNIPFIGPNLFVSPLADPSDGFLDLVTAGEEDRDALYALVEEPTKQRPTLPTRRVRRVEVLDCGAMHVDDQMGTGSAMGAVSIGIEPGKVEFLV